VPVSPLGGTAFLTLPNRYVTSGRAHCTVSKSPYAFNIPATHVGDKVTDADKAMGVLASGYWVAFGKHGDPNGDDLPEWPRHDPSADRVINFTNDGVVVGPDPLKARLDLWKKVFDKGH
jgi:para-nitrobenzyl esterase